MQEVEVQVLIDLRTKPNPKHFFIDFGAFPFEVLVTVNYKPMELARVLKKHNKPVSDGLLNSLKEKQPNSGMYCFNEITKTSIIYLLSEQNGNMIDTFSHELVHCVECVLKAIGIPLHENTEEVRAYLNQHLMQQFLKAICQQEKK